MRAAVIIGTERWTVPVHPSANVHTPRQAVLTGLTSAHFQPNKVPVSLHSDKRSKKHVSSRKIRVSPSTPSTPAH